MTRNTLEGSTADFRKVVNWGGHAIELRVEYRCDDDEIEIQSIVCRPVGGWPAEMSCPVLPPDSWEDLPPDGDIFKDIADDDDIILDIREDAGLE